MWLLIHAGIKNQTMLVKGATGVNPSLTELPLNYINGLAELGLTSLVK